MINAMKTMKYSKGRERVIAGYHFRQATYYVYTVCIYIMSVTVALQRDLSLRIGSRGYGD